MSAADNDRSATSSEGRRFSVRQILGLVFVILFIVFLVENTAKVNIRFVGPRVHAPLYLALLIAAVLGSLATLFIQRRRGKR
jgi:uncharacterized integral membrane protein